ncbi:phage integrase family protein [Methanococcus maripaludis C5]|uniref:Phage integrase family protein n=2 Tax=Methanococcus maripaludis TaxID=39152 RepID=A4FZ43_METM5|nr:tyrosine-type recombinase/integrase [Methanococcus maripaludis]ABO35477.1 phage integrase family protein [Methanococcus maripaludis C5]MBA2860989.1 integrase/recombinase XerD [Methanococcus maripaludis]
MVSDFEKEDVLEDITSNNADQKSKKKVNGKKQKPVTISEFEKDLFESRGIGDSNIIGENNSENEEKTLSDQEYIEKWKNLYAEKRKGAVAQSTLINELSKLPVFFRYTIKIGKKPDEMTKNDFIKFFDYLQNTKKPHDNRNKKNNSKKVSKPLSRNTIWKYYLLLKTFYLLLELDNFDEFSEYNAKIPRLKKPTKSDHYDPLLKEHFDEIIRRIIRSTSRTRVRDVLALMLLWDSGARVSEVLNLTYKDCDFKTGRFKFFDTKNGENRTVICSHGTLDMLNKYLNRINIENGPDDYIIQVSVKREEMDDKLATTHLSRKITELVKELKKEGIMENNMHIVLHSLRHGRAYALYKAGVPIPQIQHFLGHKDQRTTLGYIHSFKVYMETLDDLQKQLDRE